MSHSLVSRLPFAALAGLLAAATASSFAAGPRDAAQPDGAQPNFAKSVNKKLVSTSVEGDSTFYNLTPGFVPIGVPIKFNCAAACTVVVQAMVQLEFTDTQWAICPTIDNIEPIVGCNFQGIASPPNGAWVTGNGSYFWTLAAGSHTFHAAVYVNTNVGLETWVMTVAQYE